MFRWVFNVPARDKKQHEGQREGHVSGRECIQFSRDFCYCYTFDCTDLCFEPLRSTASPISNPLSRQGEYVTRDSQHPNSVPSYDRLLRGLLHQNTPAVRGFPRWGGDQAAPIRDHAGGEPHAGGQRGGGGVSLCQQYTSYYFLSF